MQGELNETPPEHNIAGMNVFPSLLGARPAPHHIPGWTGAPSGPETIGEVGKTTVDNQTETFWSSEWQSNRMLRAWKHPKTRLGESPPTGAWREAW